MASTLPSLNSKFRIINDIIDFKYIKNKLKNNTFSFTPNAFNIVTVSRIESGMKGLDIAMKTLQLLVQRKVKFHWFFVGKGSFRGEMEKFITQNNLNYHITFLGTSENPYKYYQAADLYVQTSRSESYGMSIAEAKLLNLPIVTTRFDTVYGQIKHEQNGLITDMNPEAVANGIERMMTDTALYQSIVENLKKEPKENTETVKKFDKMIEELLQINDE